MIGLFTAGGVVMVPVLVVGLLAMAVGLRHASKPEPAWAACGRTLRASVLLMAGAGVAMDLSAASTFAASAAANAEAAATAIFLQGFSESMSPMILGGALAALAALFAAVGDLRAHGGR